MQAGFGRNEGLLLMSGALWGTAYVAIKIGLADGDPYLFALLRFVLGAVILLGVTVVLKRFDPGVLKDPILWVIGLLNAVCIVLQNVGMTMTTATNTALLFNTNVPFIAILAAVILKDRLPMKGVFGLGLGVLGAALITTNGDLISIYSGSFQGDLLIVLSGLSWAFCTIYIKKVLDRGGDAMMVTTGMFLLSSVWLVPMVMLFTTNYSMSATAWEVVAWTGIVCTGIAYLAYTIGLEKVSVTIASIICLSESVFAVIFAYLLLTEVPSSFIAVGGVLVAASILIISLPSPKLNGSAEEPALIPAEQPK